MKTLKPGGSGFAIMHTKTIIIDDAVFVSGSLNLTQNGLTNNVEEVVVITDPFVVRQRHAVYERQWSDERAETVDMAMIRRWNGQPIMYRRSSSTTPARRSSTADARDRAAPRSREW